MALVLCTGINDTLIATRKLLLERAGHKVVTATGEPELIAACIANKFDVAVIGQTVSANQKHRVLLLIREHCPPAKVLELFSPNKGQDLADADDWLEVPASVPSDLAERVSALAGESS